ncbi:MAG: hypothetical protein MRY83_18460 [Flavobacteriales bacterium]|nr:hypothetical protein [Flavobacteriales bacterium]
MNFRFNDQRFYDIVAGIITMSAVFVILFTLNRGLDLTDEGFYLYEVLFPSEDFGIIRFNLFLNRINHLVPLDIFELRFLRACLTFMAAVYLMFSVSKFSQNLNHFVINPFMTFCLILTGSWLSYCVFPRAISYNSFSLICFIVAIGCVLRFWYGNFSKNYIHIALLGFMVFLQLITKISSGIILLGFSLFVILFLTFKDFQTKVRASTLFLIGILSGLLLYSTIESPRIWLNSVQYLLEQNEGGDHDLSLLSKIYFKELLQIFGEYQLVVLPIYLTSSLGIWLTKHLFSNVSINVLKFFYVILFCIGFWISVIHFNLLKLGSTDMLYVIPLIGCFLVNLLITSLFDRNMRIKLLSFKLSKVNLKIAFLLISLFTMPFMISFGTNAGFTAHSAQYLIFWILLFTIAAGFFQSQINSKLLKQIISVQTLLLLATSAVIIFNGGVLNSYKIKNGLLKQKVQLSGVENGNGIFIDARTSDFVENVNEILNKNIRLDKDSVRLLSMDYPALNYLLGYKSPGRPWYKLLYYKTNCFSFNLADTRYLKNLVIVISDGKLVSRQFKNCLFSRGVDFPKEFRQIGSVANPFNDGVCYIFSSNNCMN